MPNAATNELIERLELRGQGLSNDEIKREMGDRQKEHTEGMVRKRLAALNDCNDTYRECKALLTPVQAKVQPAKRNNVPKTKWTKIAATVQPPNHRSEPIKKTEPL